MPIHFKEAGDPMMMEQSSDQMIPKDERGSRTGLPETRRGCGLHWYWHLAALILAAVMVISRQPDRIFHAQFFGEDGVTWFADAYNRGWVASLFRPEIGYIQLLPRLAAGLALLVSLQSAPFALNLVGLLIQVAPVTLLLSARMREWGALPFRAGLCLIYLAVPNCGEINVTITNAQWHLALLGCLLALASLPKSRLLRIVDISIFCFVGLNGPFCIFLLPIAVAFARITRERERWFPVAIMAISSALQGYVMLFIPLSPRIHLPLGAGIESLAGILASQIYLGALLGGNALGIQLRMLPLMCVALIGTATAIWLLVSTATLQMRLFALFAAFVLAASLATPMVFPLHPGAKAWESLAAGSNLRYWFLPTLIFAWAILSALAGARSTQATGAVGLLLAMAMCFGLISNWRLAPYTATPIASYAARFQSLKSGEILTIPENPPGWFFSLRKK